MTHNKTMIFWTNKMTIGMEPIWLDSVFDNILYVEEIFLLLNSIIFSEIIFEKLFQYPLKQAIKNPVTQQQGFAQAKEHNTRKVKLTKRIKGLKSKLGM